MAGLKTDCTKTFASVNSESSEKDTTPSSKPASTTGVKLGGEPNVFSRKLLIQKRVEHHDPFGPENINKCSDVKMQRGTLAKTVAGPSIRIEEIPSKEKSKSRNIIIKL